MTIVARIDNEEITAEDFIKLLKLGGKFDGLIEELLTNKLMVHEARKQAVSVSVAEIQERVDDLRRARGLHRAKDTLEFLERLGVSLDDFENYIGEELYREKMLAEITSEARLKEYVQLHLPRFDSVELGYMLLDSEGKAQEIAACLEDEPDMFEELAREHSIDAETRDSGGAMGRIMRGLLPGDVEARIFGASAGQVVGPFPAGKGPMYELFIVRARYSATLDDEQILKDARKLVRDEWVMARAGEHVLEVI
jgi:parvulin-like peptidyl-prolyl isomerase